VFLLVTASILLDAAALLLDAAAFLLVAAAFLLGAAASRGQPPGATLGSEIAPRAFHPRTAMRPPPTLLLALALALAACKPRDPSPPPAGSAGEAPPPPASAQAARCARRGPARIERAAAPGASSSVELVRAGGRLFALVADADERALHAVDAETMREVGVTELPGRPGHVLALADGRIAVAIREGGRVMVLEPTDDALTKPFEERCSAEVAVEPWALADGGERLFVVSGAGAALTVLGAGDLVVSRAIRLPREPRGLLLANEGATAFVTHAVGGIVSAIDLRANEGEAEAILLHAGRRMKADGSMDAERPREASQGYALASVKGTRGDGGRGELRIFAPHTSVDPGAQPRGVSFGYGGGASILPIAPIVSVIDPVARRSITDHVARAFDAAAKPACLLPRGAVADEGGLFVACLDLSAVLELDPWLGDPSVGERRRIPLPAGPSALALAADGGRIFAWSEIDRALSRVERAAGTVVSTPLWRRAGVPRDAKIDRGRRLFHTSRDARISRDRACASCHPEGRDDGLVWTSPDGPRQTPTLAGRLEGSAPYGWFGESPTVKEHLRKTFSRLGGTGLDGPESSEDLDALIAYVAQIPPPPAAPAADTGAAERGKKAFASYCDDCHKDGGTDGESHDVGSGLAGERRRAFDTPTLRGVRGTAPYFHDGRYATLDGLLEARDQRMFSGVLSEQDRRDLIAYLETL
jgi:mono/diheme cytochrome c family protein